MKKWTHSLPAKIIAIFLTTLIAAGTILSAVGAGVMVSKDFYTQSEESLRSALPLSAIGAEPGGFRALPVGRAGNVSARIAELLL